MNFHWFSLRFNSIIVHVNFFIICICLFFSFIDLAYCQISTSKPQSFRRHFIIAYDISSLEDDNPQIKNSLISLFSNLGLQANILESLNKDISKEQSENIVFFNPKEDDISFYYYGVTRTDFPQIRNIILSSPMDSNKIVSTFIDKFIKKSDLSWASSSGANLGNDKTIPQLFENFFKKSDGLFKWEQGYNNRSFVMPFILQKLPGNSYASEYILLVIGRDDISPSTHNLFSVLPDNGLSAFRYIQNSHLRISSKIVADQYFTSSNNASPHLKDGNIILTKIYAYKVIPSQGFSINKLHNFSIESDIKVSQNFLATTNFNISKIGIKSNLIDNFLINNISLSVFFNKANESNCVIDTFLYNAQYPESKSSDISSSIFASLENKHFSVFPELKLPLPSVYYDRDFKNLLLKYNFFSSLPIDNQIKINYIFTVNQIIDNHDILFSSKIIRIFMLYVLPSIFLCVVILFLVFYGRPKLMTLCIEGYLDSFEIIDFRTVGRLITPFKPWDSEKQTIDFIPAQGEIFYKSNNYMFNWNLPIYMKIRENSIPEGFDVFLKNTTDDLKEFGSGIVMPVIKDKDNIFSYVICIRQNDITQKITIPKLVKIEIEAEASRSIINVKSNLRTSIEYNFHIGEDLGDVWVGFDPGTTGSCVAVGSSADNILLGEDKAKNNIIPSIIVFEKSENYRPNGNVIPEKIYKHGSAAQAVYPIVSKYKGFQSLKKLLGFKDIKEVVFDNKEKLQLKGKDLAGLLVKGLYKDITNYFTRPNWNADDYKRNGMFNPLRAVVAIPNNCTISKIQDTVDCIRNLNQFKEIRYVYEAEAVLFYYLSHFSKLCQGERPLTSETILVFDMGGATINATIVTANKTMVNKRPKYDIDFLGKIGYGIGGDTIDYCIGKFLLSFKDEFPNFSGINMFSNKIELAQLAFEVKVQIIENYYRDMDYLITAFNLAKIINDNLKLSINIDDETSEMYGYFKRKSGRFKLFDHPLFVNTIYKNVNDAIMEVIELSGNASIDKVIFSGRSTLFPKIKETVEEQLTAKTGKVKSIALNLEESKVAVAKGACWYGINKNSIILNNLKTNAAFGFKKTNSADKTDVKFIELVEMGCTFDIRSEGVDSFQGVIDHIDDFAFDGGKVNFYQVMGKSADKILAEGQKHKFSKIASINLDQVTSKIAMKVNENDDVECAVVLQSSRKIIEKGEVADQEIDEANEEHYTWIVK